MPKSNHLKIRDGLIGLCIGDALGVPKAETNARKNFDKNSVNPNY
ncbi:hypothetical protein [Okeania sp.]|nr:hypothetical protein [Okeania sp.]MEB3343648.1 hypothetical protein [Okeania sp.]